MDIMQSMGLKDTNNSIESMLYVFMKEFHFNPLDEEFVDENGNKWKKKGLSIPLFIGIMEKAKEQNDKEARAMK